MEEIEKDNIRLRSEISENDEKIQSLDAKLKELTSRGIPVRHFPMNKNWRQVLEDNSKELDSLIKKKELLIRCINDQNAMIEKQEEIIQKTPFSSRKLAFSRVPYSSKRSKMDVEFNEIQNRLIEVELDIKREKIFLKNKKEHISNLKVMTEEIKVMKASVDQQLETEKIEELRNNIQILKTRIADHQNFLNRSPEKLVNEYKILTDILIETRNKNSGVINEYSSKIDSIIENL
jgi:hypothetical protein